MNDRQLWQPGWVIIALALLLILVGCANDDPPTNLEGDVKIPTEAGIVTATEGGVHWSTNTANVREVLVGDRQTDPEGRAALKTYVQAMRTLWDSYPGLPRLTYQDQSKVTTQCPPNNIGAVIPVCTGKLSSGIAGETRYSYNGAKHFQYDYVVDTDQKTQGMAFSLVCHELGHALGLAHSTDRGSCTYASLTGPNKGYTAADISDLVSLYYSHFPS